MNNQDNISTAKNTIFHWHDFKLTIIAEGIIVGLLGIIFNRTLLFTQDLYAKQKWLSKDFRPVIPFLLAEILGPYCQRC